jgi:hypothetical protein
MGLFGSDKPSQEVQDLVEGAKHHSIDAEVLGKTSASGFGSHDYLNDGPLVDHLKKEEQPHYVFPLVNVADSGVFVDNGEDLLPDSKLRTIVAITDQRILIVVGSKTGDRETSISYTAVSSIELDNDPEGRFSKYELTIGTEKADYKVRRFVPDVDEGIDEKFRAAGQYIAEMTE